MVTWESKNDRYYSGYFADNIIYIGRSPDSLKFNNRS